MNETPVLTSLVLTLHVAEPATVARHVGPASHGVLLRMIADADPDLAERLHRADHQRPFTCSTLLGGTPRGPSRHLDPEDELLLRYTGLNADVSAHLTRWVEAPPPQIEIHGTALHVTGATVDPEAHPWAGQTTYEKLAAPRLLPGTRPDPRAAIRFYAPTAFQSGGQTVPLPLPDLVYGGLVDKWNAFADVAVSEEMRRFAAECVAVSRYRLETHALRGRGNSLQIGFMGRCQFTALNKDRYWVGVMQMLTDYAFYAGVGYQTTMGMGQARRWQDDG
jgi:CRISPR-associated endoribonuclease Cas6